MSKLFSFFFFVIFLSTSPFAQINKWYHNDWDKTTPKDFEDLSEHCYRYDLVRYKNNMYIGKFSDKFALDMAKNINSDIVHGNFYKSFGYEDYLRKVLTSVVKDTSLTSNFKMLVYYNDDLNFSMDPSGIIRIYVGGLARITTEAELAMALGHEATHFANQDGAKHYGHYIQSATAPSYLEWAGQDIGRIVNMSANNWNSREEEAAADFASINYMKKTPYSLKAGANLFKQFKREEIREEIKQGKTNEILMDHPDPGDRLKQVKFLSSDSLNIGKKNFVVDSMIFVKMREQAYEETVNIELMNGNYVSLLNLTFTKYLFEPDNQYNLAVLIETIRRVLAYELNKEDKKYQALHGKGRIDDQSFILSQYQSRFVKKSDNYGYLNDDAPPILKHLTNGFLEISKDDIKSIKAKEPLDTNHLAFTTYKEAYAYFKKKAAEMNCKICEHYKYFSKTPDYSDVDNYVAKNDLFETNDLLKEKGKLTETKNDMFVVFTPSLIKGSSNSEMGNRKTEQDKEDFYNRIIESASLKLGNKVVKLRDLSYKDQHVLFTLMSLCAYYVRPRKLHLSYMSEENNWTETSPELYSYFKRNNIKNLYICIPDLYQKMDKKEFQTYLFFKINPPNKNKDTFFCDVDIQEKDLNEDTKPYVDKLAEKFKDFFIKTKN